MYCNKNIKFKQVLNCLEQRLSTTLEAVKNPEFDGNILVISKLALRNKLDKILQLVTDVK
jgi:hypothetical protein